MAKSKTNKPYVITSKSGKDKAKETKKTTTRDTTDYSAFSPKVIADNIFAKIVIKSKGSIMPSSEMYDFTDVNDRILFVRHLTESAIEEKRKQVILDINELVNFQKKFDDLQKQYDEISSTDVKKAVSIGVKLAKTGEDLTNAIYLHNCIKTNLYNLTCEFYRRYICNATNGKLWEKLCNNDSDEVNFIVNLVCELDRKCFINDRAIKSGVAKPVPLIEWLVFAYTTENNSEHGIAKETLEKLGYID